MSKDVSTFADGLDDAIDSLKFIEQFLKVCLLQIITEHLFREHKQAITAQCLRILLNTDRLKTVKRDPLEDPPLVEV
jgi:hypothetical protein